MKIFWTNHALAQLSDIYEFILKDSKFFALKTIDNITNASKNLEAYPLLGRIVPEIKNQNIREIIHGNYRIIYKLGKDKIEVLAVLHSAQNFLNQYFSK